MKRITFLLFLMCIALTLGLNSCQEDPIELQPEYEDSILKKGSKPADVEQGDLYGDLVEIEREASGLPVLYPLAYATEYQDELVEGIIDVHNPRLSGTFDLYIVNGIEAEATLNSTTPPDGEDPLPGSILVTINPGEDGFLGGEGEYDPTVLYDTEGELLADVVPYVFPVEQGRLNLVRTTTSVIERRMIEVLKNFGDGTVAEVVKDYCGRLYMLRTEGALDTLGMEDKPIDSPLENMALYKELMNHGFSRSVDENGLNFIVNNTGEYGGFNFRARLDNDWNGGVKAFTELNDLSKKRQFVANLAAACIGAASDKSDFLTFDEISYVNQFMGIPHIEGFNSSIPDQETTCFFPTICQKVRMMNKTDKSEYSKYRYYVDYSNFSYNRTKFMETLIDYVTMVGDYDEDGNLIGSHIETLADDLLLHDILMGNAPLTADANEIYRYTTKENQITTGMLGFANQADDYVQALEVIHNNEEYLRWEVPTPTWEAGHSIARINSPFLFEAEDISHSKKPDGKGDDETTTSRGRRGGR